MSDETTATETAPAEGTSDLTITEWEVQEVAKANDTEKQPVVFVHGLTGARSTWHGIAAEVSSDHHVYSVDLRGHGGSSKGGGHWSCCWPRHRLPRIFF